MKRLLLSGFILVGLAGISKAGLFDSDKDRMRTVSYQVEIASGGATQTSTNTILIDLSDTTNWPHSNTREINISGICLDIDKVSTSSGSLKIGVVNFINTSTGSVTWFYPKSFEKNVSNTDHSNCADFSGDPIKTRVEGGTASTNGTTPYIKSSDITSGSTLFQTDVVLPSTNGNTAPGRGDIIFQGNNRDASNFIKAGITIQYYTPESQ